MRHAVPALLAVSAAIVATPAAAERVRIDVPAGRAADAAIAIARQTGTSIVIADPDVAERRVRAIRGRMEAHVAIRKLVSSLALALIAAPAAAQPRAIARPRDN